MWRFNDPLSGEYEEQADTRNFLAILNSHAHFFDEHEPLWLARAPGRLDLMGGIADYSGSLVLELPLGAATWVAVQPTREAAITLFSPGIDAITGEPQVSIPLASLQADDQPLTYAAAHTLLSADPRQAWTAYAVGVLIVLQRECGIAPGRGLRLFIHSDVPAGKGVSSSAALEVATMQALCGLYDLHLQGRQIALLCQQAENLVVGAPCGVMDQMTSACGEQQSLLALLCQPAELQDAVSLPEEIEVWGIDSGIRHAVTGADYGSVRVGAFMGYRIIAEEAGLSVLPQDDHRVSITDPFWHGYLANISPSLWETTYKKRVPLTMNGAMFLERYRGSTDLVTSIDPERVYAIRQPTAHPIYEHHRVQLFRALLQQPSMSEESLILLGELMYQSHASYSACGLGSTGTDKLVELVRQAGPATGLYGAKITGGGCGGTVAVLARRGSQPQIERIAATYARETGLVTEILSGSSPGAVAWGCHQLVAK